MAMIFKPENFILAMFCGKRQESVYSSIDNNLLLIIEFLNIESRSISWSVPCITIP